MFPQGGEAHQRFCCAVDDCFQRFAHTRQLGASSAVQAVYDAAFARWVSGGKLHHRSRAQLVGKNAASRSGASR